MRSLRHLELGCVAVLLGVGMSAAPALAQPREATVQSGLASFYGEEFDGQATASGATFDHRELVAAHPTLPLGTVIRVTNVKNGRSVRVRVIDRGPYGKNRRRGAIVDLSRAAARQLKMIRDGIVPIRLRVLRWPSREEAANRYNDGR